MTGHVVAYIRVSSAQQDNGIQREAVTKAGATRIYEEVASATSRGRRPKLEEMIAYVRDGDTVIITKIDRLARSMNDLLDIVRELAAKGARLKILDQDFDTSTAIGGMLLNMLGCFAQFENDIRKERQLAGIAKARDKGTRSGKPFGRRKTISRDEVRTRYLAGEEACKIAREMGITRQSVHNIQAELGLREKPSALTSLLD